MKNKKKLVSNLVFRYNLHMIEYLYGKFVDRLMQEFPKQIGFREANRNKGRRDEEISKIFKTNDANWRKCRAYMDTENNIDDKNPFVTKFMLGVFDGAEGQEELESYIIGEKYLVYREGIEYKNVKKIILPSEITESLDRTVDNYFKHKNSRKSKRGSMLMLCWISEQLGKKWKIKINENLDERVIEEVDRLIESLTLGKMEEIKMESLKRIRDKWNVKLKEINAVYTYRELVKKTEKQAEN